MSKCLGCGGFYSAAIGHACEHATIQPSGLCKEHNWWDPINLSPCPQCAAPPQADAEALLRRVLETMEAEARAILMAKNAEDNFSSPKRELDAMQSAMVAASEAVKAARAYLAAKDAP